MIVMANGATVYSVKLHTDTARGLGPWHKDGQPYGVVLAEFHGEFVTWAVWLPVGATEWQASNGRYFGQDYYKAMDDFDNRPR